MLVGATLNLRNDRIGCRYRTPTATHCSSLLSRPRGMLIVWKPILAACWLRQMTQPCEAERGDHVPRSRPAVAQRAESRQACGRDLLGAPALEVGVRQVPIRSRL